MRRLQLVDGECWDMWNGRGAARYNGRMEMKRMQENEIRIIKVTENAIRELLYETIIENGRRYFDLPNDDEICYEIQLDLEKGEMLCAAFSTKLSHFELDRIEGLSSITETTSSFFSPKRHISFLL